MRRFFRLFLAAIVGVSVGICARKMYGAKPEPVAPKPEAAVVVQAQRTSTGASAEPSPREEVPPYPTGYLRHKGRVIVQMSDGTTRMHELGGQVDPELTVVHTNSATIDGKKMFYRASPRKDSRPLGDSLASPSVAAPLAALPVAPLAAIPSPLRP